MENRRRLEEPETYLKRRYLGEDEPAEARRELVLALREALRRDPPDADILNRGLFLVDLIPHPDFRIILTEVFFTIGDRPEPVVGRNGDVAKKALRAMYKVQAKDQVAGRYRRAWETMWLNLLDQPRYGALAFQGMIKLNPGLALECLPQFLQLEGLKQRERRIILRALATAVAREDIPDVEGRLAHGLAKLPTPDVKRFSAELDDAFGTEVVQAAQAPFPADDCMRVLDLDQAPLDRALEKFFDIIASWLVSRFAPIRAASIWMNDKEKHRVAFLAQFECPGGRPRQVRFPHGSSGAARAARSGNQEVFDLADPSSPVYWRAKFLAEGICGLLAVPYDYSNGLPSDLSLVVDLFAESVEALQSESLQRDVAAAIEKACEFCLEHLRSQMELAVAKLSTRLADQPGLASVVEVLSKECQRAFGAPIHLEYYYPEVDRFLPLASIDRSLEIPKDQVKLGKELLEYLVEPLGSPPHERSVVRHVIDADEAENMNGDRAGAAFRLELLEVLKVKAGQSLHFLGGRLREPAPREFLGLEVGVVYLWRIGAAENSVGFTPLAESLFEEFCKVATSPLITAVRRHRALIPLPVWSAILTEQKKPENDDLSLVRQATEKLIAEFRDLLRRWLAVQDYKQAFAAFRTLSQHCEYVWADNPSQTSDAERDARLALHWAMLARGDALLAERRAVVVDEALLQALDVSKEHQPLLISLGLILVPLLSRGRVDGVLGVEFDESAIARKCLVQIHKNAVVTNHVRNATARLWSGYRKHRRTILAAVLRDLFQPPRIPQRLSDDLLTYLTSGGRETPGTRRPRSYDELVNWVSDRQEVDPRSVCNVAAEWEAWNEWSSQWRRDAGLKWGRRAEKELSSIQSPVEPKAVRLVFASATTWSGSATCTFDRGDDESKGPHLRIETSKDGDESAWAWEQGTGVARHLAAISGLRRFTLDEPRPEEGVVEIDLPP